MDSSAIYESKEGRAYARLMRHNARLLDLDVLETVVAIRQAIRNEDNDYAVQLWNELSIEEQIDLWIRESKGSIIPKSEQEILKPR